MLYKRSNPVLPTLERKVKLVLDVGCGTGFLAKQLSRTVETVGLDREKRFLRAAKTSGVEILVCGDALHLPFAEEAFDLVCMYDLIHHLKEPDRAVSEAQEVLKKHGYLFVKDVKKCGNKEYYLNVLADWFELITYGCPLGRYFSEEEWKRMLSGFNTVEMSGFKNEVFFLGEKAGIARGKGEDDEM